MPKGEKVKKPTNKYGLPVDANYLENLRKIFASNKYTFDMNMNVRFEGQTFYVPTVICRNGKKIAMDFEIGISSFLKGLDKSASSVASAFFSLAGVKNMKIKYISTGTKSMWSFPMKNRSIMSAAYWVIHLLAVMPIMSEPVKSRLAA
jgi:hypothetical protein